MKILLTAYSNSLQQVLTLMGKAYTKSLLKNKRQKSSNGLLQQPIAGFNLIAEAYMETLMKDESLPHGSLR